MRPDPNGLKNPSTSIHFVIILPWFPFIHTFWQRVPKPVGKDLGRMTSCKTWSLHIWSYFKHTVVFPLSTCTATSWLLHTFTVVAFPPLVTNTTVANTWSAQTNSYSSIHPRCPYFVSSSKRSRDVCYHRAQRSSFDSASADFAFNCLTFHQSINVKKKQEISNLYVPPKNSERIRKIYSGYIHCKDLASWDSFQNINQHVRLRLRFWSRANKLQVNHHVEDNCPGSFVWYWYHGDRTNHLYCVFLNAILEKWWTDIVRFSRRRVTLLTYFNRCHHNS